LILAPFLFSGSGENVTDNKEIVELHIYPETAYHEYLFSDDMYGEFLQYSEGTNPQKHLLLSPGESFNNFNYKKGFNYVIKATKTTIKHPLHKDLNVIYEYIETIAVEKSDIPQIYSEVTMEVAPVMISFMPRNSEPKPAYLVKISGENKPRPVTRIEGFKFKKGYTYRLRVKRSIWFSSIKFNEYFWLLEVISKHK